MSYDKKFMWMLNNQYAHISTLRHREQFYLARVARSNSKSDRWHLKYVQMELRLRGEPTS